jgi:hypothetical protein
MLLKSIPGGKAKLLLKAKGANLDLSAIPQVYLGGLPITSQLIRNDDPTCWEATFPTAIFARDLMWFKAKIP